MHFHKWKNLYKQSYFEHKILIWYVQRPVDISLISAPLLSREHQFTPRIIRAHAVCVMVFYPVFCEFHTYYFLWFKIVFVVL